jgi:hypothetical protein
MDEHAMIEAHLQQLSDARDCTAPGSPEEEQACLAILDAMLSGGGPEDPQTQGTFSPGPS